MADAQKVDYRVVGARNLPDLQKLVNGLIAEGWRPTGGVAMQVTQQLNEDNSYDAVWEYAQAMILAEPPKRLRHKAKEIQDGNAT